MNTNQASAKDPKPCLTCTEYEVAQGIANGYSLVAIAERLGKSVPTVSIASRFARLKLKARSITEIGTRLVLLGMYERRDYTNGPSEDDGEVSDGIYWNHEGQDGTIEAGS